MKTDGGGKWPGTKLADRLGSLGTDLEVRTTWDATRFSLLVTSDRLESALQVLAAVARRPRLSLAGFSKLRQREAERARDLARNDGRWAALMVLHRELFELPAQSHPYSNFAATADDLNGLHSQECQRWHRTHVTPNNSFLVVAGDVASKTVAESAHQAFDGWKGERQKEPSLTDPLPPTRPSVHLVDHPKSKHSHILVGALGPPSDSAESHAVGAAIHLLGSRVTGRLQRELVQQRSLADATDSQILDVPKGPTPIVLSARTSTAKTALATEALLAQFARIGEKAPRQQETQAAGRQLAGRSSSRAESVQGLAKVAILLKLRDLPHDHFRRQRETWTELSPQALHAVAQQYFLPDRTTIVVTGDASRIARALSHFGPVSVIDPTKQFVVKKTLPHNPSVSLTIPAKRKR